MQGGNLSGHLRDLGGDRWELIANLRRRPGEARGRRATKRIEAKGIKRARTALTDWLKELSQHDCTDPDRITLGEVLRRWLEQEAAHNARPKTLERYRELVERHILPELGAWLVAELKPVDLSAFYQRKQQSGRLDGKGGLSPQTAHHLHAVIRAGLTWAEDEDLVDANAARRVKHPPRAEHRGRAVWTSSQIAVAIDEASHCQVRVPAALAGWCGLRRGEVCALRWIDVDLPKRIISVRQSVEQVGRDLYWGPPKSAKSRRFVPIPARVIAMLEEQKRAQDEMCLAFGGKWNERGLVCCRPDGKPTMPANLTTAWRGFVRQHGLMPVLEFHGLRRSYLSGLHDRGAPDRLVTDWAGHENVATTHEHYTVTFAEAEKQALRRLEEAIETGYAELAARQVCQSGTSAVVSLAAEREKRRR